MTGPMGMPAMGAVCALGCGREEISRALLSGREDFLSPMALLCREAEVLCGIVPGEIPELPAELRRFSCRAHRLAWMALQQILPEVRERAERLGPGRIGVVVGSSTAGIDSTEAAYPVWKETGSVPAGFSWEHQHEMGSAAGFVRDACGVSGPCWSLTTACSSGAKVFASARSLLRMGLCDVVVTGGVDTLCRTTMEGFDSLQSLSHGRCTPFAAGRDGLNLGEGAAFFLLEREDAEVRLLGVGESSDAHHMNAPDPQGRGAEASMRAALADAGLLPADVGYLNLHGTSTPLNDAMEAQAVARVFPDGVPCASTKPLTGHCLGAAGAVEAALCWIGLAASEPLVPRHLSSGVPDSALPALRMVNDARATLSRRAWLSSSFAFGGSNCTLALGRRP